MHYLICTKFILIFLFLGTESIQAQEKNDLVPFGCQPNFYQLKENQLCVLHQRFDGTLWFQPILEPFPFEVSAMGLEAQEGYIYILNKENGHILKLGKLGGLEDLGLAKSASNELFPYEGITVGEIGAHYFFVYHASNKSLYSIDLKTMLFRKVGQFPNSDFTNISFDPQKQEFICIDAGNKLLTIQLYGDESTVVKSLLKLPSGRAAKGSVWSANEGKWFVGRQSNQHLYELDLQTTDTYQLSTNLEKTTEDGTSCPYAATPPFLDNELLKLYIESYPDGQLTWVKWSDRGGLDIDAYELEKSIDGQLWETIAWKPNASNGKAKVTPYGALDKTPSSRLSYYRLKKIFNYGGQKYSRTIVTVKDTTAWQTPFLTVAPNVLFDDAATSLFCNGLEGERLELTIENSLGQLFLTSTNKILIAKMVLTIPTQNLPKGTYTLKAACSKTTFVQKILVF